MAVKRFRPACVLNWEYSVRIVWPKSFQVPPPDLECPIPRLLKIEHLAAAFSVVVVQAISGLWFTLVLLGSHHILVWTGERGGQRASRWERS